jgi:hypothetical protein
MGTHVVIGIRRIVVSGYCFCFPDGDVRRIRSSILSLNRMKGKFESAEGLLWFPSIGVKTESTRRDVEAVECIIVRPSNVNVQI